VLAHAKVAAEETRRLQGKAPLITKTSLMLGLGEDKEDIRSLLRDLRKANVDVITFGQYLRPSRRHHSVIRYVPPEEFAEWQTEAEAMGFLYVASGPMVRSSYKAGEFFLKGMIDNANKAMENKENEETVKLATLHSVM
jgi:lipoic acid synthetase